MSQEVSIVPSTDSKDIFEAKSTEFELFVKWLAIPSLIRRPPRGRDGITPTAKEFALSMGLEDEVLLDLVDIRTQREFAERYHLAPETLSRWKLRIAQNNPIEDIRGWASDLNRNVAFSLYNRIIKGGMPEHYKLWFQLVAGWRETMQVDTRVIQRVEVEVVKSGENVVRNPEG